MRERSQEGGVRQYYKGEELGVESDNIMRERSQEGGVRQYYEGEESGGWSQTIQ